MENSSSCEMCKIPSGGFRSHQCAVKMEIQEYLYSVKQHLLINALGSSVDENRLKGNLSEILSFQGINL